MYDMKQLMENIQSRGLKVCYFDTGAEAATYLDSQIDGVSVGIGGSMTVKNIGLYPMLSSHNTVHWHWEGGNNADSALADVYLTSANALAMSGEMVNIDGNGNRIASCVFGHKKVYYIVSVNKITPDLDSAIYRARHVAGPLRAQSMGKKTPCAAKADKCYDCKSPDRICNGMTIIMGHLHGVGEMEVVLIGEDYGM